MQEKNSYFSHGALFPAYSFTTNLYDAGDQFQAYCDEYASFGSFKLPHGQAASEGFKARWDGYRLGPLRVAVGESDAHSFAPRRERGSTPHHDHWVLALRMQGAADIQFDNRVVRYQGDRVELRGGDCSRSGNISKNQSLLVYLPRAEFMGMEHLMDSLALVETERPIHPLLGQYLLALGCSLPHMPIAKVQLIAETTMAMVRACIKYSPEAIAAAHAPLKAGRFEFARKYITDNISSPQLTPDTVSAALAISRRQLYYIFESVGGFYNYVRSLRLEACSKAILEGRSGRSIAAIASEFGFNDPASFSRAFRSQFGCTPSDFRISGKASPAPSPFMTYLT